jgi:hypothetical protein
MERNVFLPLYLWEFDTTFFTRYVCEILILKVVIWMDSKLIYLIHTCISCSEWGGADKCSSLALRLSLNKKLMLRVDGSPSHPNKNVIDLWCVLFATSPAENRKPKPIVNFSRFEQRLKWLSMIVLLARLTSFAIIIFGCCCCCQLCWVKAVTGQPESARRGFLLYGLFTRTVILTVSDATAASNTAQK